MLRHLKESEQENTRIKDCLTTIDQLVSQTMDVFALLNKAIQEVRQKNGGGTIGKPSKRTWLRNRSRLEELTTQVTNLITSLTTALGILQGFQHSTTSNHTSIKLDLVLSQIRTLTQKPPDAISSLPLDMQIRKILDEIQKAQGDPAVTTPASRVDQRSLSRRSSTESFYSVHSNSTDSTGTLISVTGSLLADSECESFCPCQCHLSTQSRMPWWITRLIGSMTVHGNGSILTNRQSCNKKHCRRSGSTRVQVSYVTPAWTFLQACNICIMAETVGGVMPSLNIFMPRIIPNNAPAWSIVELGNLSELRDMLSRREVSPYDVSVRGISLLKASLPHQNPTLALTMRL